ncbi:MAG: hypothetical protein EBT02_04270 [Planctomycetia bacterium]|nr:hypothetical protein [Planctomycetia bacterium]
MNCDSNFIFSAKFVEAFKTIWIRVCTKSGNANSLAKIKHFFVGIMIFGKSLNAKGHWLNAIFFAKVQDSLELFWRAGCRNVLLIKLSLSNAKLLHFFQGSFEIKVSVGVGLNTQDNFRSGLFFTQELLRLQN